LSFELGVSEDGRQKARRVEGPRGAPKPRPRPAWIGYFAIALFLAVASVVATVWPTPLWVPAGYLGMSVMCFVAYAIDKSAARGRRWRVAESTLLLLGLIGGWPGGMLAQQVLRHKTRKPSFLGPFWVTVVLNVVGLAGLSWFLAASTPI